MLSGACFYLDHFGQMEPKFDISVVICTYNRAEILPAALQSLTSQVVDGLRFEIIVVDNNSTDRTRDVVMEHAKLSRVPIRYIFERKQGLSYARNTGISKSQAPILAFTDDDVTPRSDWLSAIDHAFKTYPQASFVGGKVLPGLEFDPPRWLTKQHWAPLALLDYGDELFIVNKDRPLCLIAANLSFRREIFAKVSFDPKVQRVRDGVGSSEDHELLDRLLRAGVYGIYVPQIVVTSTLDAQRLRKHYHRIWHTGHGRYFSLMRIEEFERAGWKLWDVPAHLYKEAVRLVFLWLICVLRLNLDRAFVYETRLRFVGGFLRQRFADFLARRHRRR
jgi:glycosyltransferase involved in cell wall biosynthesis